MAVVKTGLGSHFQVGEFTTHFRTYFSGDWDVHWGNGDQNGTLVSGNMDQNLRSSGSLTLTHTQMGWSERI